MNFSRSFLYQKLLPAAHVVSVNLVLLLALALNSSGEQAVSADAFVSSVGINVHLHNFNTGYSNFAQVESALKQLRVRHVRDGLIDTTWKDYYNRHNELGRAGIKGTFITSANQSDQLLLDYPARMKDSFEAFEAPNEYDQNGGANWASTLTIFLNRLAHTVKNDSRTSKFSIIGPSLTRADSFAKIQGICSFDFSNLHNYFSGRNPGTGGWGTNGYGSIVWNLANVNTACSAKPTITTETGYQTITTLSHSVPEDVAAKYVPRVFLEQWLHGVRRTYLYELIDLPKGSTSADKGFGLLREDFSHKPSYTALANLLSLLADPGPSFAPAVLAFQLTGDLTNVHHVLFQKRNGWFYLALWVEEPAYDVDGKKSISVKPRQVTVHTTKETGGVIRTFDVSGVLKSAELPGGTTHSVQVSDSVSILEIGNYPVPPIMNVPVVHGSQ